MKVVWSAEAAQCLRDIVAYIAQDSPAAARKVAAKLLMRSRQLAEPPLLGRCMSEYPDEDLRELLERPYRLIYRVTSDGIEIVTLKHYRQRLPRDPKSLRD
ncbi:MAG TPA: type II toxin-antitoxin system RelE/ParE family toxin [Rhodanobacteraceae bacterium]|nr:type II toxin-antitoxin system RelE/ParE family toxin [Rhodanobacteraceae bacterium]